MAEARQRVEWDHTANIIAVMMNQWRDEKKRAEPYQPFEFNPMYTEKERKRLWKEYREQEKAKRPMAPLEILKRIFCKGDK